MGYSHLIVSLYVEELRITFLEKAVFLQERWIQQYLDSEGNRFSKYSQARARKEGI